MLIIFFNNSNNNIKTILIVIICIIIIIIICTEDFIFAYLISDLKILHTISYAFCFFLF